MKGDGGLPRAYFEHPDGSWYCLWMTRNQPRTARGHPWHVHASYDKTGTLLPKADTAWYEAEYGMANWDFEREAEAREAFLQRVRERLRRGYVVHEAVGELEPPQG